MNETDDGGMGTCDTNHFSCYINNSRFTAENQTIFKDNKGKCFLGRNWNNGHRSLIMNSYIDDTIAGQGYKIWSGSVLPSTVLVGTMQATAKVLMLVRARSPTLPGSSLPPRWGALQACQGV
jgi:hypothetical protein